MKRFRAAALVMVIFGFAGGVLHAQTDKRVTNIRAQVAAIDKAGVKYTKKTRDVFGISTEGAAVTYYRSGKELKKIGAKIYGETFRATSEFYFKGDELIFVYDRISHYDTQIGLSRPVKVVRIEEIRTYFEKGKMFQMLNGKKMVDPSSEDFVDNEKSNEETLKVLLEEENKPIEN